MSKGREKEKIILERGAPDRLVPADFTDILTRRYFPVLSLTYISAVLGIAEQKGDFYYYIFENKSAYVMALLVALWVSIPAVIWILLKNIHGFRQSADDWYKIIAGLMVVILMASYVLFPETHMWGIRIYFAATIPVFIIMYVFFVKGGLPPVAAYPLTVMGLTTLIHGALINILH